MDGLKTLTLVLLIVGGVNWLLMGLFSTDVGMLIFGGMDMLLSRLIYVLVGLSALYQLGTMGDKK